MASCWQGARLFEETNGYVLQNGILSDVKFLAGKDKRELKAHKVILASRSPVFYTMFCGSLPETNNTIEIPDIESEILEELLRFVYTEECEITNETVTGLLYGAKKYEIKRLTAKCTEYLKEKISVENICSILMHAHQFDNSELAEQCCDFIYDNADAVITNGDIKCMSKEVLQMLLKSDYLCADELDIYTACKDWAVAKLGLVKGNKICNSAVRNELGNLLYLIRFPLMDPKVFANKVSKEDILSADEKNSIFQSFFEDSSTQNVNQLFSKTSRGKKFQYVSVVRFEKTGRGWRNSSQLYGIDFKVSKLVKLVGVNLFLPSEQGSISGYVKLLENGKVLSSKEVTLEYQNNLKFRDIRFEKHFFLKSNKVYTILQSMKGVNSYKGDTGRETCFCECLGTKVEFSNRNSGNVSGATRVNTGQIRGLIFS